MNSFSPLTQEALKYYVYLLHYPDMSRRPESTFYVGKGTGNRIFAHVSEALEKPEKTDKLEVIRKIHESKKEVEYTIIRHGMSEKEAFEVEAAIIDLYGIKDLKNEVLGHGRDRGKCSAKELDIRYGAKPVVIDDPVFLGFCTEYDPDWTSADELFHYTSYCWKVNPLIHPAKYAFSVNKMIIREVYEIQEWFRDPMNHRWYFDGKVASDGIRDKYLHKDISSYISQRKTSKKTGKEVTTINQNLKWVNC